MARHEDAPPNFSWVEKGLLAASAMPRQTSHYKFFWDNGIRQVITLRAEQRLKTIGTLPELKLTKIGMQDFCPPTINQIEEFIQIVEDAKARNEVVVVHCASGYGRTGTMLACFLVKTKKLSGSQALQDIRNMRPGSVETSEQEKVIEDFYQHFKNEEI